MLISRLRIIAPYRIVVRLIHTGTKKLDENKSYGKGPAKIRSEDGRQITEYPKPATHDSKESIEEELEKKAFEDRVFQELSVDDYQQIIDENHERSDEIRDKINQILSEYEYEKYSSNGRMPSTINIKEMKEALMIQPFNTSQIMRYLTFLFKKELAKKRTARKNKEKREAAKQETQQRLIEQDRNHGTARTGIIDPNNGQLLYGLWHNSLFVRLSYGTMRANRTTARLRQAAMFNQKLVVDFSYDSFMSRYETRNISDQILLLYGLNRYEYEDNFDLHFCNFNKEKSLTASETSRRIQNLFTGSMITTTDKCYSEIFPKHQIIYLSPHARKPLLDFIEDDIFVIGAMNDKVGPKLKISNELAERAGVRCRRLPLETYVSWLQGTKSLCLNQVVGILLEYRKCHDWKYSLEKYIPPRKLKSIEQVLEEDKSRMDKLFSHRRFPKDRPKRNVEYEHFE